jgi:ABC-type sugar transport system substrate-binding protein
VGKDLTTEETKIAFVPMSTAGDPNILAKEAADDLSSIYTNMKIEFFDAGYDATKQNQIISDCIAQGYDAIVMEVTDSVVLSPTIKQAEEAGIPVITMNVGCEEVHTLHIENSSYNSGEVAGKAMVEAMGQDGKVIVLDVPAELQAVSLFGQGYVDYVTANSKYEIVDRQNIAGFSKEEANTVMRDLLTKYDEIDAVYCVADDVAAGAAQAIEAAGRGGEGIIIWGSDCTPVGINGIKDGSIYGSCFPDQFGAVKTAFTMALYFVETGMNCVQMGYTATPSISRGFVPATKDNIDAIAAQSHYPEFS